MWTQIKQFICFKQGGIITTLSDKLLKLVDKFTYLGSNISSTESDVSIGTGKAGTAIDWLLIIWKFDLSDKIKRTFFQAVAVSVRLHGCTRWILTKRLKKKIKGIDAIMLYGVWNRSWKKPLCKTATVRPLASHLTNHPSKMNRTCWALLEK